MAATVVFVVLAAAAAVANFLLFLLILSSPILRLLFSSLPTTASSAHAGALVPVEWGAVSVALEIRFDSILPSCAHVLTPFILRVPHCRSEALHTFTIHKCMTNIMLNFVFSRFLVYVSS